MTASNSRAPSISCAPSGSGSDSTRYSRTSIIPPADRELPLKLSAVPEDEGASHMLQEIEAGQAHLREILLGLDSSRLSRRPPSGGWSVVENVRHLLFAEQLHLSRFVPGGPAWSLFGFTPETMRRQRRLPPLDGAEAFDVEDVLAAWAVVH